MDIARAQRWISRGYFVRRNYWIDKYIAKSRQTGEIVCTSSPVLGEDDKPWSVLPDDLVASDWEVLSASPPPMGFVAALRVALTGESVARTDWAGLAVMSACTARPNAGFVITKHITVKGCSEVGHISDTDLVAGDWFVVGD